MNIVKDHSLIVLHSCSCKRINGEYLCNHMPIQWTLSTLSF